MGVRTITITDAAYERLAREKRPGESFTDVVLRLTGRRSLGELADAFSPTEARALAEAVIAARDERRDRRARSDRGPSRSPDDDDWLRRDARRRLR